MSLLEIVKLLEMMGIDNYTINPIAKRILLFKTRDMDKLKFRLGSNEETPEFFGYSFYLLGEEENEKIQD